MRISWWCSMGTNNQFLMYPTAQNTMLAKTRFNDRDCSHHYDSCLCYTEFAMIKHHKSWCQRSPASLSNYDCWHRIECLIKYSSKGYMTLHCFIYLLAFPVLCSTAVCILKKDCLSRSTKSWSLDKYAMHKSEAQKDHNVSGVLSLQSSWLPLLWWYTCLFTFLVAQQIEIMIWQPKYA